MFPLNEDVKIGTGFSLTQILPKRINKLYVQMVFAYVHQNLSFVLGIWCSYL